MPGFHRFSASSEDDQECTQDECGVIVADDSLPDFFLPCPTAACTDPSNVDAPCVFTNTPTGPECSYCGRSGGLEQPDEDDDVPLGDLADEDLDAPA